MWWQLPSLPLTIHHRPPNASLNGIYSGFVRLVYCCFCRKAVTAAFTQALAKAMAPPSTFNRAPHPPSTHRIQQFITLFSNNESVTTTVWYRNIVRSVPGMICCRYSLFRINCCLVY
jgi:hypothetical protein